MVFTTTPSTTVSSQAVKNALAWRYATKHFDPVKELTDDEWNTLELALTQSPSSFGLQPWKFIVLKNRAIRALLRASTPGQDQSQITQCSHYIVFAAKQKITEKDVDNFIGSIAKTRGVRISSLDSYKKMMIRDVVKMSPEKHLEWSSRQCYLALGNLVGLSAMMGIDTCPMEGINPSAYDKLLELQGYSTVVACAVGFRCMDDKYFHLKKVRYEASQTVVKLY